MTSRKPPSQRNAEYYDQRRARQLQSMVPGTLEGRLADAQPFKQFSGPPDALFGFDGGANTQATRASKVDIFTLPAGGAQDLTLTYVPVVDSWNVIHNREGCVEGEHFTLDPPTRTLSLLAVPDALTGDTVRVQYDYLEEQADPIEDIPALDIPFSAAGWKYTVTNPGTGWEQPTFDDSAWTTGQMPIGNSGYSAWADDNPNSVVAGDTIWVRRQIGPGTNIDFDYRMARYMQVYVDGTLFTSQTPGTYADSSAATWTIPDQFGIWTLAITVHDFTIPGPSGDIGVNIEIEGDEA
jgi:hypothetical protein